MTQTPRDPWDFPACALGRSEADASSLSPQPLEGGWELKSTLCEGKPSVAICAVVSLDSSRSRKGSLSFSVLSFLLHPPFIFLFVSDVFPLSPFFQSWFFFPAPLFGRVQSVSP